eukprot:CAMPEP_0206493486 /NCGR_PEP_ID=MMETSP0324_2-20121206/47010_1 /ASSEMBLY_ACC=CAM_ASM_000836 /TAXON_ID=2866 /ORGANISM="Crypthecodinium cohnii, Strain Seligo" /LENGTH=74 /DNA_ID=CAMNT_0053976657 /DNA_START=84 /DNA_END=308 /DNA_ORIENTATION=-
MSAGFTPGVLPNVGKASYHLYQGSQINQKVVMVDVPGEKAPYDVHVGYIEGQEKGAVSISKDVPAQVLSVPRKK